MKETRNNEIFVSSWAIEIDLHSRVCVCVMDEQVQVESLVANFNDDERKLME